MVVQFPEIIQYVKERKTIKLQLRMEYRTFHWVFVFTLLASGTMSQFITEPGDEVLYGEVGHPLLVPCVLERDHAFKIWNIAGNPNTPINNGITLFPEYADDYRLIQSGTNFSLLILSLQLDQPPLYCHVANPGNYKSSISRIQISGRETYLCKTSYLNVIR